MSAAPAVGPGFIAVSMLVTAGLGACSAPESSDAVTSRDIELRLLEAPTITAPADILVRPMAVRIESAPGLILRYTLDGTDPTMMSARYDGLLRIDRSVVLRTRAFEDGAPVSAAAQRRFQRVQPVPGRADFIPGALPGLVEATDEDDSAGGARASRVLTGYIVIPDDDVYRFELDASSPARLLIGGTVVAGLPEALLANAAALAAGWHAVRIESDQGGGGLPEIRMATAGRDFEPVPPGVLFHVPGERNE